MFARRRPLLRAAVVGGGAYVAGKSVARRQTEAQDAEADQDARLDALEQQQGGGYAQPPPQQAYAPPPAAAPPAAGGSSIADQLNQLADLHAQGALTDEEFAAAKAGILGG